MRNKPVFSHQLNFVQKVFNVRLVLSPEDEILLTLVTPRTFPFPPLPPAGCQFWLLVRCLEIW